MKRLKLFLIAFTAILTTSCSDDDNYTSPEPTPTPPAKHEVKIIAHRGFFAEIMPDPAGAENSVEALTRAEELGVYGSEFDVIKTKDDYLVIYHDDNIIIDGVEYRIDETNYDVIKDAKLSNGETLPTLDDYLKEGLKNKTTRLVFELKQHKDYDENGTVIIPNENPNLIMTDNDKKAIDLSVERIKAFGIEDKIDFISFSLGACIYFKELLPNVPSMYLSSKGTERIPLSPDEINKKGLDGISYSTTLYRENPTWIKDARKLGLKTSVWTVKVTGEMYEFILKEVDFITTDQPRVLKEEILANQIRKLKK